MSEKQKSRAEKIVDIVDKVVDRCFIIFFLAIFLFCVYAVYDSALVYNGADLSKKAKSYIMEDESGAVTDVDLAGLRKQNDEIIAWLHIDNTRISFPVLYSKNNSFYLNHDYLKQYSVSGSIFLDMYNSSDFSDDYNLIYGHNMNGQKMFGPLGEYSNEDFINSHTTGTLFTPNGKYKLNLIAYLQTTKEDQYVYNIMHNRNKHNDVFYDYFDESATYTRDYDKNAHILALSTCFSQSGSRGLVFFNYSTEE